MGFLMGGGQRRPEIVQERERQKQTKWRFTCGCGAELLLMRERDVRNNRNTTQALVAQAHAKHVRETGCEKGIA